MASTQKIKSFGYDVITAHSDKDAVRVAIENDRLSLIFMDINLGKGIDGTEAARQILSGRPLPIVFLTSHSEKDSVNRAKQITRYGYVIKDSGNFVLKATKANGVDGYVSKKALLDDLAPAIEIFLSGRR